MPLFGHHNNPNNTSATGGHGVTGSNANQDYRTDDNVGPLGTGTGPTMHPAHQSAGYSSNQNAGQAAYNDANANHGVHGHHNANAGQGAYQSGMSNLPPEHFNNQGGIQGGDPYANTIGNNDVAPINNFSSGHKSGGASATTGKVERIIGTLVGSESLKAKGIQKEQQAAAFKVQSAEISEAERLEQEAGLRRQRAVDHGAHPANMAVGGAAQAQEFGGNFGQTGGGMLSGNNGAGAAGARGGVL